MERTNRKRHRKIGARFSTVIYTLFGAYIIPRGGEIYVAKLIELVRPLGFSANATRLGLSRMSRHGVFNIRRAGRRSYYSLSRKGMQWMEGGRIRAFETKHRKWDGRWRIVVYRIPERVRRFRDGMRVKLQALGFARLSSSIWISPHDLHSEIAMYVKRARMTDHIELFEAKHAGPRSARMFANLVWNIDVLERKYGIFVRRYGSLNSKFKRSTVSGKPLEPVECFAERFCMTAEYVALRLNDPILPPELLPSDWVGLRAHRMHEKLWSSLKSAAEHFVDTVLQQ